MRIRNGGNDFGMRIRRGSNSSGRSRTFGGVMFLLAAILVVVAAVNIARLSAVETVTVTVSEKESVAVNGGHEYRIYTDKEVLVNSDEWLKGKWNSADVYNQIHEKQTYRMKVYGWRIPFLSMFRNILEVTPVNRESETINTTSPPSSH